MPAGRHASRPACGQIGRLAGVPAGRQASVYATIRINRKIYPINMPKGDSSSVSILLLGSLSIGKRYSESGITAIFPIRRTRILVSTKTQQGVLRVTRRLFGYCRKVAAARYVLSNSKLSGLLPKPCRRVASPKSGNLFQPCSVLGLFLVFYAVQSYLVVQCGTPYAEQCCRQCAVAFCLFQRMDDLFLFHVV